MMKILLKTKKLLLLTGMMLFLQLGYSQQKQTWLEDFDGTVSWTATPSGAWMPNSLFYLLGSSTTNPKSYWGAVPNQIGDSTILETGIYDCRNYDFVYLRFSQICKIAPQDYALIEYRVDLGSSIWDNWVSLPQSAYLGLATNYSTRQGFNAASYSQWQSNDNLRIPEQSWWRDELFDLTGDAGHTQIQFRFVIKHGTVQGTQFCYGWLLENFQVEAATYDIRYPTVQLVAPLVNDTVYSAGTFEINAKVKTNTRAPIQNPILKYTATNGTIVEMDSISMTHVRGDSLWKATMKQFAAGTRVDYSIVGRDSLGNGSVANSYYIIVKPASNYGNNSVALTRILSPDQSNLIVGGQNISVEVTIRNKGDNALTTCTIDWVLNGVQKTYNWSGNLPWDFETKVVLGNYTSRTSQYDTLTIRVSLPNGAADPITTDDTLTNILYGCTGAMLGDYTVGAGQHFSDIKEAIRVLPMCGVSGDVRFLLASNTYPEQWDFTNFGNFMGNYMLTITSKANHRDSVILEPASGVAVTLNNTYNVKFEALTINGRAANNRCVFFTGTGTSLCANIVINNCNLLGDTLYTSSGREPIYKGSGTGIVNGFHVTNCLLDGGYRNVDFYGGSGTGIGAFGTDIVFDSNIFLNAHSHSIYGWYAYFTSISYNLFLNRLDHGTTSWYGIYGYYATVERVLCNRVKQKNTTPMSGPQGMYFSGLNSLVVPERKPILIANNELMMTGSSVFYGINISGSGGGGDNPAANPPIYILHNSVYLLGTTTSSDGRALVIASPSAMHVVKKNMLSVEAGSGSSAVQYGGLATVLPLYDADSNNYYSPLYIGSVVGYFIQKPNIDVWRQRLPTDQTSDTLYPSFVNPFLNLKLRDYSPFLCERHELVLTDINGMPRSDTTAYGCYVNIVPVYVDAALQNILGMRCAEGTQGQQDTLKVELLNNSTVPLTEIDLCWTINGISGKTNWKGNLAAGNTEIIALSPYTYLSGSNTAEVYLCGLGTLMDEDPRNNKISISGYVCTISPLVGTFSIPNDFPNLSIFADAVRDCGVQGIITLDFGKHIGNVDFNEVGLKLNNMPLIITGDTIYAPDGNTIILGNNRNLTFEDVVIQSNSGYAIHFVNSCTNIVIRNCTILADPTSAYTTTGCINKGSNSIAGYVDSFFIIGNTLDGGYYGISVSAVTNIIFDSNTVSNQYYAPVSSSMVSFKSCSYNTMLSRTTIASSGWFAIYLNACGGRYIGNRIIQRGTGYGYGLFCNSPSNPFIANNELIMNNNNGGYGIYIASMMVQATIINNSIYMTGTSGFGIMINDIIPNYPTIVKNNNIVMTAPSALPINFQSVGYAPYCDIDYNNLYAPTYAGGFGGNNLNLAAWQAATGFDANSVSILPNFINVSESLELSNYKGFYCPLNQNVPNDINDNPRMNPTVMGAYTFSGLAKYDMELSQIIAGSGTASLCVPELIPIRVVVANNGYSDYDFNEDTLALYLHIDGMKGIFDTVVYIASGGLDILKTATFTITDFLDVSFAGDYHITAWLSNNKDANSINDTLRMTYRTNKVALPYEDDFSTSNMQNMVVDNGGWKVVQGGDATILPNLGTGMLVFDAPRGTISSIRIGQIELERTIQPQLELWYAHDNKDASSFDQLDVIVSWNGGVSEKLVDQIIRYDANYTMPTWKQYIVDLSPWVDSACVMVYLKAYGYGGIQHIDKIAITSKYNLALDALLISDYSLCDLTNKELKVVLSNTTNQWFDFSERPTDIVFEMRGDATMDKIIPLSGTVEAFASDTFSLFSHIDFKVGEIYNMRAYLRCVLGDANKEDDTIRSIAGIAPDLEVIAVANTGGDDYSDCFTPGMKVEQIVTIKNNGNFDIVDIPIVLEILGEGGTILETTKITLRGALEMGNSRNWTIANSYTVPDIDFYNVIITAELRCDANLLYSKKTYLLECAYLEDIALTTLVNPSLGVDNMGKEINVEVTIENRNTAKTYEEVIVNALIQSNGNPDVLLTETITNFVPGVMNYRFTDSYTVPAVANYMLTVFVNSVDNYPLNDTITAIRQAVGISDYNGTAFTLGQNIPNPAKDNTRIEYILPNNGQVIFTVYSITGQNLYTEKKEASSGKNNIEFSTANLANGIYYYSMEYKGERLVKKMTIRK